MTLLPPPLSEPPRRLAKGGLSRVWTLRCSPPRYLAFFAAYQHPIYRRVLYSPAVAEVLRDCHAAWVLDSIAEWIGPIAFHRSVQRDARLNTLCFSTLTASSSAKTSLLAHCRGVASNLSIAERDRFTEFLGDELEIIATGRDRLWLLRLPDET